MDTQITFFPYYWTIKEEYCVFDGKEHAKQKSMYHSATADDTSVFVVREGKPSNAYHYWRIEAPIYSWIK